MAVFTVGRKTEISVAVDDIKKAAAKIAALVTDMKAAVEDYNGAIGDAQEIIETVTEELEEFIDGKSEKWQEGDKGQAWRYLKSEWDNLELEQLELPDWLEDFISTTEILEQPAADLENAPTEPDIE